MSKQTRIELTGRTFGRLTVLGPGEKYNGKLAWVCRCACGTEKSIAGARLRYGQVKSCGCLRAEISERNLAAGRPAILIGARVTTAPSDSAVSELLHAFGYPRLSK